MKIKNPNIKVAAKLTKELNRKQASNKYIAGQAVTVFSGNDMTIAVFDGNTRWHMTTLTNHGDGPVVVNAVAHVQFIEIMRASDEARIAIDWVTLYTSDERDETPAGVDGRE